MAENPSRRLMMQIGGAAVLTPALGDEARINHVHFRNVIVRKPYVDYTDVFVDEGQVDKSDAAGGAFAVQTLPGCMV